MKSSNSFGKNKLEPAKILVDHCKFEYEDLSDTWRDIERKAQGGVAIVGIFLIGGLTYLRFFGPENPFALGVIFSSMAILVVSALFAVSALLVDEVKTVQSSGEVREDFDAGSDEANLEEALRQYLDRWGIVNEDLSAKNDKKSARVLYSQYGLLAGIIGISMGVVIAFACGS